MVVDDQKIRVIPDNLNNLIIAVQKGYYRIPQFQREYVWEKSKVISLFDSIYKEYPIGSFFLWRASRKHNDLFRHSIDLGIAPIHQDDNVTFILDGQQRITSLYVALQGLIINNTDYSRICFDLKEEKFTHREPDNNRYVRVCDVWGPTALKLMRKIDEQYTNVFDRCYETLKTYPISIVEVRDKDLPAVCNIFQRINQGGKRLDRFDLISAMTFTPDFDLREKFKYDILNKLEKKAFGKISPSVVTQLMALVKKGACTERVEYSLTSEEIKGMWESVVISILLAADTLRKNVGVQNANYLPYEAILTMLSYFYAKSGQRALSNDQMNWVKEWFWRASFSQYYGSGGPTKMGRDKDMFDKLQKIEFPKFNPPITLTLETLVGTKMTWTRSAIRNAFLCLLANREPLHLINNSKLDLVTGGISGFTSPEKHHIFPQAFLKRDSSGDIEVHALPNFCFLPSELNKRILDDQPSKYFPELSKENDNFVEATRSHLIPDENNDVILQDDYLNFLQVRGKMILNEIEQLTGISTAPPEDRRQQAVEHMETRLRDFIHNIMAEKHGLDYWKHFIPGDVKFGAENRIENEIKKQPERNREYFESSREKLNYCNPAEYLKIIISKNNWSAFESVFRRKQDLERHLEAFSEFRNAVMHGRELTEITQKGGELSLIWLENVLPAENQHEISEE